MNRKNFLYIAFIVYAAIFTVSPINSQNAFAAPASASSAAATGEHAIQSPIEIYELSDLISQAGKAASEADEKTSAIISVKIEYVKDDALNGKIADSRKRINKRLAQKTLNLSLLNQEFENWSRNSLEIEDKFNQVGEKISEIEKLKTEFVQKVSIWEKNRDFYKQSKVEGVPMDAVYKTLSTFKIDLGKLDDKLAELLDLQEKINKDKTAINEHLDFIDTNRKDFSSSTWFKDSPAVYEPQFMKSFADMNFKDIKGRWVDYLGEFVDYYPNVRVKFTFEILALLVLWFLMRGVERSILRRAAEVPEVAELGHFFKNKFSIAIILILMPAKLLHPEAPLLLREMYWFLLSVPVMILLIRLINERKLQKFIIGIWLASLVDIARVLLSGSYVLERFGVFAQTVFGLFVTLLLLNPQKLDAEKIGLGPRGYSALKKVRRALVVVLAISLVAELLGYHSAAMFLSTSAFRSIYITFFMVALSRLLKYFTIYFVYSTIATKINVIKNYHADIVKNFNKFFVIGLIAVWLYSLSVIWKFDEILLGTLKKILGAGFSFGENKITLGIVVGAFLAMYIAGKISHFFRFFLEEDVYPRKNLHPGLGSAINQSIRYTFAFIGGVIALGILGFKFQNILIIASALGVGIGFGLQNIVNNFVSGIIMLAERPIRIGDIVETGGVTGTVRHIGIRATRIETFNNAEIIVPNGDLLWSSLVNWTHTVPYKRIVVAVGVSYSSDPKKVMEILETTAKNNSNVIVVPPAAVFFMGFGDSSLNFELRCYVASIDVKFQAESELKVAVLNALKEAGVEIPYPQHDINIRSIEGLNIEKK